MKTAITAAVIFFIGVSLADAQKEFLHKRSQAQLSSVERQPLISPEGHGDVIDFKRSKRQNSALPATATKNVERFQEFLNNCKAQCAEKMGLTPNEVEKLLLFEENPTPKEKCMMACVLERTKIMNDENKVSVDTIGSLAGMISHYNELVMAIARAAAENCNRHVNPSNKCDAAAQINRCVASGLKAHRVKIVY